MGERPYLPILCRALTSCLVPFSHGFSFEERLGYDHTNYYCVQVTENRVEERRIDAAKRMWYAKGVVYICYETAIVKI